MLAETNLVNDDVAEFDVGPLSWVQGEIGQSLARGLESLAAFSAEPPDPASLKHARNYVHQAAGAIQMVGLDAVVTYTDEIERQLARIDASPEVDATSIVRVVDRACKKLVIFLDELVGGAPPVPLKLFPEYEAMQHLREVKAAAPTDLFYPDLTRRAPARVKSVPIPSSKLAAQLLRERRTYQRGLLTFLRGDAEGARKMRDAVSGIERVSANESARTFWWTAGAFFDAIIERNLDPGFGPKQLAARIDLQIRRVVEGSSKVADRLRREVLYYVAVSVPAAPSVRAVQRCFALAALIPSAEVLNADLVRLQPILRDAREQLGAAKDMWLKVTTGRAESLPKLRQALVSVHASAVEIRNPALTKLAASLVARLDKMPPSGNVSEPLAMEYATGMLLAESAVENFGNLSGEFPKQVEAMMARLDAAQASRPMPAATAPILDEMFRRAHERMLLTQVAREIQVNLRHMEQVLDAFFRDHEKRADLATLGKDSQQIRGALKMLGQDDAERLLGLCQDQIDSYGDPDATVGGEDLELLAESLSGLGFYVEALEQQRPDRQRLIAPLLAKRLGQETAMQVDRRAETVEHAVEELRSALPALVAEVHRAPADAAARKLLKTRLADLVDDAKLIDDNELVAQAQAALAELEAGGTAGLAAVVTAIAESSGAASAPAPAISEETQRLLATDATGLDAELLDIYLTEAAEVLDTIATNYRELEANPSDRDALQTVRRQFHTLKGSGRMVGLTNLGELAFDVETIHNRLLDEERFVTPAVLAMIGTAETEFRQWIATLKATGAVVANPAPLRAAIAAVEAELPCDGEPAAPARTTPAAPLLRVVDAAATVEPPPAVESTAELEPAIESTAELEPELESMDGLESRVEPAMAQPEVMAEAAVADSQQEVDLPDIGMTEYSAMGDLRDVGMTEHPATVDLRDVDMAEHAAMVDPAMAESDVMAEPAAAYAPARVEPPVMVELPELGMAADAAALATSWGDDAVAADEGAEFIEFAPSGDMPVAMREHERETPPPPEAIAIGDVTLAPDLYAMLVEEADLHLATLADELSVLQFHSRHSPSEEMVRASHTLCGIHRAGGLPLIAVTAMALEKCLLALQQTSGAMPEGVLPVLSNAVRGLEEFVGRVKARAAFNAADSANAAEIQQELETLKRAATYAPARAAAEAEPIAETEPIGEVEPIAETEPVIEAEPIAATTSIAEAEQITGAEAAAAEPMVVAEPTAEPAPAWVPPPPAPSISPPVSPAQLAAYVAAVSPSDIPQDPLADIRDDVDEQVLPIFIEEAAELYPQAGEQVRGWRRAPADVATARQLRRTLHTFKGSARMAGAMRLGELVHLMESRLSTGDSLAPASPELFEALDADLDRIGYVFDALRDGKTNVPLPEIATSAAAEADKAESVQAAARAVGRVMAPAIEKPVVASSAPPPSVAAEAADFDAGAHAMLRVRADIIDRLVNEAGEVAITRARIESELRALKANLLELTGSVVRLRTQVREFEIQAESQIQSRLMQVGEGEEGFDPLEFDRYTRFQELARSLAEGINDVSTIQQSLLRNLDVTDAALVSQARLSRDVQQQLFAIRTVPFGSLSERLYRILRGTAKELDKRANLEIGGAQTELDRSVLEKLVGPLEHLLRNALDHGIEPRGVRAKAGKSETGEITLTVRQIGNEIAIELIDDGAGLNLDRIRAKAVAQGRIAAEAQPTADQLIAYIFEPGFSTAAKVTQVSGRGIGMDVVRAEIAELGGRVEVSTRSGKGTTFTFYLPLTLAVAQAVLVRAAGRLWALPAPMVEKVEQMKPEALVELYVQRRVEWQGVSYPFHYLPRLLGNTERMPESTRTNAVLLLRSGQNVAAVHVDEMIGNQEVVVKNIGPQLARVPGIAGATVLGTGEIVLIINPVQLALRADVPVFEPNAERMAPEVPRMAIVQPGRPLVMIVDDSLTVRRITSRLLTREGFDVVAAKDGIDALELLQTETPDVILLDIEMPRMDGFEFTKKIKSDPTYAGIPIVMITSRTAEKHRNRAKELGVELYLGKPFQEEELLTNLREMLALTP